MFFKLCLRMKYVLQDHNQSLKVPHLEIQVSRTMLQKLSTNNVCNKPDHEDLWACKTSDNMFLEFPSSIFWWHLTPNRGIRCCTTSLSLAWKLSSMQQGDALHQQALFPFPVQNLKKNHQTAPPSTLLATHHFHTLQYETAQLGSNTVAKSQWAAPYWLICIIRSPVHNLFLSVTIPWNRTVRLELWWQEAQNPWSTPYRTGGSNVWAHS